MLRRSRYLVFALGVGLLLTLVCLIGHPVSSSSRVSETVAADVITDYVYLPAVFNAYVDLSVDPTDREASQAFFDTVYRASAGADMAWTGNHATCAAGSTSQAWRDAMLLRINYFRAMAGVPPLWGLSDEFNDKAQQAALMMSVNHQLSHDPDESWTCYTAEGDEAAGSSNLYLGNFGPSAITGYMEDFGTGNYAVGHRRWILYPQTQEMGTGDVPYEDGNAPANALWVFDDTLFGPRPETRDGFVAWPPPGYVPNQLVFLRWSFSYPGADFSSTTITMTSGGTPVSLTKLAVVNGYGENTVVWEPDPTTFMPETTYLVTLDNVKVDDVSQSFSYEVSIFDAVPTHQQALLTATVGELGRSPVRAMSRVRVRAR